MHALLQLSLYTGQQLVLEGLHRWLQRPCQEEHQLRARRTSLKSLIVLLAKTAATGVLATILDAAIEYRRRQVLQAAAAAGPGSEGEPSSRLPTLGMLSRAGISALKTQLLLGIDELERRAEAYGIEGRHRAAEAGKQPASCEGEQGYEKAGNGLGLGLSRSPSLAAVNDDGKERQRVLARTVEQLRSLVKEEGEDAEERLDREVESLLDSLLGGDCLPASSSAAAAAAAAAAADESDEEGGAALLAATSGCSSGSLAGPAVASGPDTEPAADCVCQICMDRLVRVQVEGCKHDLCFQCARRLCDTQDHQVPQCPFCRQTIGGFAPC